MLGVRTRGWITVSILSAALGYTPHAAAEDTARVRAEALYADGLRQLRAGRPEQALSALDASAQALSSPNTDLLRAHALRMLGRRVPAMLAYESVVREAGARVRAGESQFEPTLADAGKWIAFLRTELGELALELRVDDAPFSLKLGDDELELARDRTSGIARARLWREPGRVRLRVQRAGGVARIRDVEVTAGTVRAVSFDIVPPPASPPAPAPVDVGESSGPPLASWVAWGIGGAGLAVFAIAGTMARSDMSELNECRPDCSKGQTNDAETKATIANIGLAIGIAGAASGGAIWLGVESLGPSRASVSVSGVF